MYRRTHSKASIFTIVLMLVALAWVPLIHADPEKDRPVESVDNSDLDKDRVVDIDDLVIFGSKYLENDWAVIDWCLFYDSTVEGLDFVSETNTGEPEKGKPAEYYKKHFKLLLTFINDHYACDADPEPDPDMLAIENEPGYLMRMANSTDGSGDIYITDPMVGSLFIYDAELVLKAELKGLNRPLGVSVDSQGRILIGNDGRDNVEAYDPANGNLVAIFGQGFVIMPNSITTGPDGNIYVTDSRAHNVKVFDANYNFLRTIGSAGVANHELNFPVDTEIITQFVNGVLVQEVFVADQGNHRIQIYDAQGNHLGNINRGNCTLYGGCSPPAFVRLQALTLDSFGRLHALDNFEAVVSIFDPVNGAYLSAYGEFGDGPGYLWVPMDVMILATGESIVLPGDGDRIEVYLPQ